jgi:hypothetical protein
MKSAHTWSALALSLSALFAPALAHAQAQKNNDAPRPPELQQLEEGEAPAVTIRKPGDDGTGSANSITQTRSQGKVNDVTVHSGGSTYHVKPTPTMGNSVPGDAQSGPVQGAQFVVKEFNWGNKKQKDDGVAPTSSGR